MTDRIVELDPARIRLPKRNSRKEDDDGGSEEADAEMVRSVKRRGLLQPISVRQLPDDKHYYELVFGSRRLRAWQVARPGQKIPCIIREDRGDFEALLDNLGENYHRRDIKPWMQAEAFYELRQLRPDLPTAAIAQEAGVSDYYVESLIRIRTKLHRDLWALYKRWGDGMRIRYDDVVKIARLPHDEQLAAWNALVDLKSKVGGGKVRGPQQRPGKRRLARYLNVALEGELGGKGREFRRGCVYALRVALGERRWSFGGEGR